VEALEHMRGNHGRGKALLYLRVADEPQHRFLELRPAHLTQYALQHQYRVARVVQEVGSGLDGSHPELESLRAAIQGGEPGYEVILAERTDACSSLERMSSFVWKLARYARGRRGELLRGRCRILESRTSHNPFFHSL